MNMNLFLVIPAFGRYPVSRVAFAEYSWLIEELADQGVTARAVVVADDGNLDLAAYHGFDTIEQTNELGRKINDGFAYALSSGADWMCFTGTDNWLHPDLFQHLDDERVQVGDSILVVDLEHGVARMIGSRNSAGIPPWLIPVSMLPVDGRPAEDDKLCGADGSIRRGIGVPTDQLVFSPHDCARVDFKSDLNLTTYGITRVMGYGDEILDPWAKLADHYPAELVEMAEGASRAVAA